jgi:hypothetical protein
MNKHQVTIDGNGARPVATHARSIFGDHSDVMTGGL